MKKQVIWDDRYKLGVDFIDKEHKLLFSTMDKLLKLSEDEGKSEWVCREGVKFLRNHSLEHFEHEEAYMQSIGYNDYAIHKRLHDNFKDKTLPALEYELEQTKYSTESIQHFLGVCIGWVISHTLTEDMAILGRARSKWINIPHEQEQKAVEKTIIQLIEDIFHLRAKMISEQYSGEYFGKILCFRFIYRGKDKKKWEVILVYEEQLILKILGGVLNVVYPKVDEMAINVIRYMSRQLLEKVRESFPALELFEMEKENLLTHEQLLDSFDREHPSCSMLFDTRAGYFGFCAINADSIHGRTDSSINPQNAMSMVKQYLIIENEEWDNQKKRVLVVDDSEFARKNMVKLLKDDYNVIEASSSFTAIQRIVMNRPDLVLLDYEMPVCDGRQTLEMIRAEETTADIPVMFLTGKGDLESVKKVMELKPEGYLLKTMPEESVKKAVDDFFVKRK